MLDTPRAAAGRVVGRLGQGLRYLAPQRAEMVDAELRRLLGRDEFDLVARLTVADRAHMLAVYRRLVQSGCRDNDLLKAALLHDIGKADGGSRVGLTHRSGAVVLRAVSPRLLSRLATTHGSGWRQSLQLVIDHPALGARKARDAGCSERVCWLIEHHHDSNAGDDRELLALQRGDEGRSW